MNLIYRGRVIAVLDQIDMEIAEYRYGAIYDRVTDRLAEYGREILTNRFPGLIFERTTVNHGAEETRIIYTVEGKIEGVDLDNLQGKPDGKEGDLPRGGIVRKGTTR